MSLRKSTGSFNAPLVLSACLALAALTAAAPSTGPAILPPRPTPGVTATADPGGRITLTLVNAADSDWVVVEWQDGLGGWHLVEGWQGQPEAGTKTWWVAPADLGTGPFRWVVYDGPGGQRLAASAAFMLPAAAGQATPLSLTLPAH